MGSGWYFLLLPPRLPGGEESCRGEGRKRGILHTHLPHPHDTHIHMLSHSHPHILTTSHSQGEAQAQGRSVFWSCSAFYDQICQPLPYSLPLTWGITWQSHDNHMAVTCQSHDNHMAVTCQSHDNHMIITHMYYTVTHI